MKKILFVLCALLFVALMIPRRGGAETPDPTPVPDALVAEALAAKQASYPAWVGDEGKYLPGEESLNETLVAPKTSLSADDWTGVVLQKNMGSNWDIFKFQGLEGDYPRSKIQLTFSSGSNIYPRYSHDATSIVFASSRAGSYDIYTMDPDGGSVKRLTETLAIESQPQWSTDGHKIVFVSDRDGNPEIYVMNVDGSAQMRLTDNSATDVYPTLSPDGSQIAWLRVWGIDAEIWSMNIDGTNQGIVSPGYIFAQHLNWSPDGQWLIWDADISGDGWNEIVLIRPDGTDMHSIYIHGSYLVDRWVSSWSPDSQRIYINKVTYSVINNQLYLAETDPFLISIEGWPAVQIDYPLELDLNHHAQFLDRLPPVSQVQPLPTYSSSNGFPVPFKQFDYGYSGIENLTLQYKLASSETWLDWNPTTNSGSLLIGNPGDVLYFRSQAIDKADNQEALPEGNGDASTTLYSSLVYGKVTDGRNISLPDSLLSFTPAALNLSGVNIFGDYVAWLTTYRVQNLSASQDAFGSFPNVKVEPKNLNLNKVDFYLPPADNIIQNSGFETAGGTFDPWVITGTLPVESVAGHSGNAGISLGTLCEFCLTEGEFVDSDMQLRFPLMRRGENGIVHLLVSGLIYYQWSSEAGWSAAYQIIDNFPFNSIFDMEVDSQGTVHIVAGKYDNYFYYLTRTASGQWSAPTLIDDGNPNAHSYPDLAIDILNRVHLIYMVTNSGFMAGYQLYYREQNTLGEWTEPITLLQNHHNITTPKLSLDQFGWAHVFYNNYSYPSCGVNCSDIWHVTVTSHGVQKLEMLTSQTYTWVQHIDSSNRIHYIWSASDIEGLGYMIRDASGLWSTPEFVTSSSIFIPQEISIDALGKVHVMGVTEDDNLIYQFKPSNQAWSEPEIFGGETRESEKVAFEIDSHGWLHFMWEADNPTLGYYTSFHVTQAPISQTGEASLSQAVSIPADMHKPTLSFMYQLIGHAFGSQSGYTLEVTSGTTTTQVISSTTPAENWTLGWADMSDWAGQTVTVTFTLHQAANEPYIRLLLDDISLGSWLTPVPTSVDITHIPLPSGPVQITITGENFIATPTVKLNDTLLENIQWIDEHTLQATVPSNLPPGRYNLWVTNPGGQSSVLASAIIVGEEMFLPLVVR